MANSPVPWATTAASSAVAESADLAVRQAAGFAVVADHNRREFALAFFEQSRAMAADGSPPLGLHVLMGRNAPEKIGTWPGIYRKGRIAPVELMARKT
jgi:hypothetical protein